MILIITHKDDYTADYIINKFNERSIPYRRFNCDDIDVYNWTIDDELNFIIENNTSFSSVWFRRTRLPNLDQYQEKSYLLNEYESLLKNLFCIIDSKWVSNPFDVYKAENKLYQLKTAKALGFRTPNSLVTNSKDLLKKFYADHHGNVVVKPLTQSRIINNDGDTSFIFTNLLKQDHIDNIELYDITPCIFQNNIAKDIELRVTVVGDKVFPAYVDSQSSLETNIDWRREKLSFHSIIIPKEIEDKCIQLVKSLNLRFGAIDLIKDTNGDYIFLEINPNGQWVWIEVETKLPISEAIINELL